MWRILSFCYSRAPFVLPLCLLSALACLWLGRNLVVDVSTETLIPPGSKLLQEYAIVRGLFGSDRTAVVFASDPELFTAARLHRLRDLHTALAGLPFVERVDSLFSLPDIRDVGGSLESSPLLHAIPDDPAALAEKQRLASDNLLLRRNIISEDGCSTALTLYLRPDLAPDSAYERIHAEIEALLGPHLPHFAALFQSGGPAVQSSLMAFLRRDLVVLLPAAGLLLVVLLSLNLGNFLAGLLPILNALISTLWTVGLMVLLGLPVNLLNYILPILILVVGSSQDIHIIHEFKSRLATGSPGLAAIQACGREIGLALLLTSSTTVLGFAATSISNLPILIQFGQAAALAMVIRFLASLVLLPAFLRLLHYFLRRRGSAQDSHALPPLAEGIVRLTMDKMVRHPLIVLGLCALLTALGLFSARSIAISNDLVSFLDRDTQVVRNLDTLSNELAGSTLIYLTLYGKSEDFLDPRALRNAADIAAWLRELPEIDTVTAFSDIVARINEQIHEGNPSHYRIPEKSSTIRQYLLFTNPGQFSSFITPDYSRTNLVIRCGVEDSIQINALVGRIRQELDSRRFGPVHFTLTGNAVLVASAVESIVWAQVSSLATMTVLLFLIVTILFLSVPCGIYSLIPNLIPAALVFGLMGLFSLPLNVGTCMVAAITLGIAIDDTLHLLVRYNRELKVLKNEFKAMQASLRGEFLPVLSTSLALACGFLILLLSSFAPVRQFGLLSAIVIAFALLSDLMVTPVLLARLQLVTLWDVLGFHLRRELLEKSPLFEGLTQWQAKKVILASGIEEYKAGDYVIRQGEIGQKMYVVLAGDLEIYFQHAGKKIPHSQVHLGEPFGEIALVTKLRRTANIVALTDCRLLVLHNQSLERLEKNFPRLALRIFANLAKILGRRLAGANVTTASPFQS